MNLFELSIEALGAVGNAVYQTLNKGNRVNCTASLNKQLIVP